MSRRKAPKSVVKRLPVYLRILDNLIRRDVEIISSRVLSEETGFTAEQIRKDLAYFGAFGTRGTGYNTSYLREKLLRIIGLDKQTKIIVVGFGHLGKALTRYNAGKNRYVDIIGVFDRKPGETGIEGLEVLTMDKLPEFLQREKVKVAMLTVPAEAAQDVTNLLVKNGITAILNFAPIKLDVPEHVYVHNADLTTELQTLIYYSSEDERHHHTE
ncbi:MAG: redox-sensing transcriptional repressor Rex [Firmicutes bacterium]|nr:redox-sensing transcriptional repressor Rex [Bacillota bacterium]HHW74013.1 redox-sensing transcriptional repressor Rex [Bacillota bacterium]